MWACWFPHDYIRFFNIWVHEDHFLAVAGTEMSIGYGDRTELLRPRLSRAVFNDAYRYGMAPYDVADALRDKSGSAALPEGIQQPVLAPRHLAGPEIQSEIFLQAPLTLQESSGKPLKKTLVRDRTRIRLLQGIFRDESPSDLE